VPTLAAKGVYKQPSRGMPQTPSTWLVCPPRALDDFDQVRGSRGPWIRRPASRRLAPWASHFRSSWGGEYGVGKKGSRAVSNDVRKSARCQQARPKLRKAQRTEDGKNEFLRIEVRAADHNAATSGTSGRFAQTAATVECCRSTLTTLATG